MLNVECLFWIFFLYIFHLVIFLDLSIAFFCIIVMTCAHSHQLKAFEQSGKGQAKIEKSNWLFHFFGKSQNEKKKSFLIDFPIDSSYTATTAPIQLQGVTSAKENWTDKHPIEIEFNRRKIFQQPISYLNSLIDFSSIECLANGLFEQVENKRRKR